VTHKQNVREKGAQNANQRQMSADPSTFFTNSAPDGDEVAPGRGWTQNCWCFVVSNFSRTAFGVDIPLANSVRKTNRGVNTSNCSRQEWHTPHTTGLASWQLLQGITLPPLRVNIHGGHGIVRVIMMSSWVRQFEFPVVVMLHQHRHQRHSRDAKQQPPQNNILQQVVSHGVVHAPSRQAQSRDL
jgi:hypothetical protein